MSANGIECSECGGTEFVAEIDIHIVMSSEKNTGQIKFNLVKQIVCADMKCRHVLESGPLRAGLVSQAKALLDNLRGKPLIVK